MYIHLMSVDKMLWIEITDEHFIPKNEVNGFVKLLKDWSYDETKKVSDDLKVRNILNSTLYAKVYYSISHHKSA